MTEQREINELVILILCHTHTFDDVITQRNSCVSVHIFTYMEKNDINVALFLFNFFLSKMCGMRRSTYAGNILYIEQ